MFSRERDASKVAFARLVAECRARDIRLIDCQVASLHLASLGAYEVSRKQFVSLLEAHVSRAPRGRWQSHAP
jgi:leucyl/phenylalanyl-tRNA--protein transferase